MTIIKNLELKDYFVKEIKQLAVLIYSGEQQLTKVPHYNEM